MDGSGVCDRFFFLGLVLLLRCFVVVDGDALGCVTDVDCNASSCIDHVYYTVLGVRCLFFEAPYDDYICAQRLQLEPGAESTEYYPCYLVSCKAGFYRVQSNVYVEKCELCPAGKHMPDAEHRTWECYQCEAGKYQEVAGMPGCTNCSAGSYGVDIGMVSEVQACIPCSPGHWQSNEGATEGCVMCAAGKYQEQSGASGCESCPAGSYGTVSGGSSMAEACVLCDKGSMQSVSGATSLCMQCGAGKYQDLNGQARCKDCPLGTFGVTVGATSFSSGCSACEFGTYTPSPGASQCLECGLVSVPSGYYHARKCSSALSPSSEPCPVCESGEKSRACTRSSPTQCGVVRCTASLLGSQPDYTADWLTDEYKCKPGEYLRGFNSTEDKDCRRCPPEMIGRDGVKCEWCPGPLEEPYALDQSGCVCKAGAVMNRTGGCECGDGRWYNVTMGGCELCPEDMYGVGGGCFECGGGTFAGARGATVCEACAQGKFREAGTRSGGCQTCPGGPGHYAVEPWNQTCAACNRSCDEGRDGWMDGGPCPDGSAGFRVCVPCDIRLPVHGRWVRGGGCVYKCDAGYYFSEWDGGDCVACSTSACPAGMQGQPCSEYEDRTCDTECVNASKPVFYSKWVQRRQQGDCPWECVDGYSARTTDYVLFQIHECVPITGSSR